MNDGALAKNVCTDPSNATAEPKVSRKAWVLMNCVVWGAISLVHLYLNGYFTH
jgi:hypothetical protein